MNVSFSGVQGEPVGCKVACYSESILLSNTTSLPYYHLGNKAKRSIPGNLELLIKNPDNYSLWRSAIEHNAYIGAV